MKKLRRIILAVVLAIVIAIVIVYFRLDSIVRSTVESQATTSLNLNTTLNSAHLAIFGGEVTLSNLQIDSPKGFTAPKMFELGKLHVGVNYGQLRGEPVHVHTITIDHPKFVLEQANQKMNFRAAMDGIAPTDPNAKPLKLIIDELTLTNAQVDIRFGNIPGLGDMKPISVTVPSLTLKNIGNADNAQNGAAVKDVVLQVATALAGKAGELAGNLPDQFKGLLQDNINKVASNLGAEFNKQLSGITNNLQGELQKVVPGGVDKVIPKDVIPKDVIPKDVGNLLGGGDKDKKKDK